MKTLHERSARRSLFALAALLVTLLVATATAQSAVGLAARDGDRTVAFGDVDDGYLDVEVAPDWLGEAEASLTLSDGTTVSGTLGHDGSGWLTFRPTGASTDIQFDVYLSDVHATTARIELDDSVGPDEDDRGPGGEGTTPNDDDDGEPDDGAFDGDDDAGPKVVIRSGEETIGYGDLDDGRLDVELLPGRNGAITIAFDPGDGSGVVTYTGTVTSDGRIEVDGTSLEEIAGLPVMIELDDSVGPDDDARDGRRDDDAGRGDDDDDMDDDDRDDDDRDDDARDDDRDDDAGRGDDDDDMDDDDRDDDDRDDDGRDDDRDDDAGRGDDDDDMHDDDRDDDARDDDRDDDAGRGDDDDDMHDDDRDDDARDDAAGTGDDDGSDVDEDDDQDDERDDDEDDDDDDDPDHEDEDDEDEQDDD